jgi:uncharacterized protein YcaQ
MTSALSLSVQQTRLVHLAAQGLLARPRRRARKADVLATIERMRVLQIDTINVVARSPYFVLFSRLGSYRQSWLDELLEAGAIFECWAHEACFAPAADFALHRRHAHERLGHWAMKHALRMRRERAPAMDALLAHIRESGPVKAADFERSEATKSGWWGWKAEKRWLEALFALGELMIARRENFQRVYDLGERVLAKMGADASATMSASEMQREFVLGAVRSLGATQARWIADYFRSGRRLKDADLDPYVESGEVLRVAVDGWSVPAYVHADHQDIALAAARGRLRATHTTLLSPFDPVVWDRERATMLFDFDYRLECYTPAPKRVYGYYVLPILRRGRLVGRLDAKAHRAEERFEVKALYLEDGVEVTDAFVEDVATAIKRCAEWHSTPHVDIGKCTPRTFRSPLRQALLKLDADSRRG